MGFRRVGVLLQCALDLLQGQLVALQAGEFVGAADVVGGVGHQGCCLRSGVLAEERGDLLFVGLALRDGEDEVAHLIFIGLELEDVDNAKSDRRRQTG